MLPKAQSADELFAQNDRPEWDIDISEWGKSVTVRELDAQTAVLIRKSTTDEKGDVDRLEFMARTILEGLVCPKLQPQDLERAKGCNASAFMTIFNAIQSGKKKEA